MSYERELEHAVETCRKSSARYSCADRRRLGSLDAAGTNARTSEFVDKVGCSAMEDILAGTKIGGEIMGMGNELGQIKAGYLADMLLVDGDPAANVRVLQDKSRILAIMKDGEFYKAPKMNEQRRRLTA